jgi:parallel beta helix pectate lyase-like protein
MYKIRFALRVITLLTFAFAFAAVAQAQATRTWVSGVGDDVNPCSRTAPCKTYAGAISKTAKDGEISTLDPGGFGAVTITKSITINGGGGGQGYGSILSALSPQGVLINITDPADVRKTVRLDWLNINGASTGTDGIRMIAGSALHVENCLIDGVVGQGIEVNVGAIVTEVFVNNTTIRNANTDGMLVQATAVGGLVVSTLNNVNIQNGGGDGYESGARSRSILRNCNISLFNGAGTAGVRVAGTADAEATIDSCNSSLNQSAVRVDLGTARVVDSTIVGNVTGLHNVGGTLKNFTSSNKLDGNTTPTSGVITPIAKT